MTLPAIHKGWSAFVQQPLEEIFSDIFDDQNKSTRLTGAY